MATSSQYINILRNVVKTFFILLLMTMLFVVFVLFKFSYDDFTFKLLSFYNKTEKINEFRQFYLSTDRFLFLRVFSCLIFLLFVFSLFRLNKIVVFCSIKLISLIDSIISFYWQLNRLYIKLTLKERWFFFFVVGLIGVIKFYFMLRFTLSEDEVSTYLFFVKRGFFTTISYYPSPNNHVFYSLIIWLMQPFFSDTFYAIKVPSLFFSIVTTGLLFLFLTKHFDYLIALLGVILFSFATNYFLYSISGRGYALMTSFAIVATFAAFELLKGRTDKYIWHAYVLASILGFYTMVIYLFPFVSLSVLIFIYVVKEKEYKKIITFFYYHFLVLLGVLLLYLPVFLVSGISAISSNPWMIQLGLGDYLLALPAFIEIGFIHILDIDHYATLIGVVLLISALLILNRIKSYLWFWILFSFFVFPIVLLLIQRLQPYGRVWTYLIFPMSLVVLVLLNFVFAYFKNYKKSMIVFFIVGVVIYAMSYLYSISGYETGDKDHIGRISSYIAKEENVLVYTNNHTYGLFVRFKAAEMNKEVIPIMDKLTGAENFNYVLLVPGTKFPDGIISSKYVLKEKNEYIEVYKLKG